MNYEEACRILHFPTKNDEYGLAESTECMQLLNVDTIILDGYFTLAELKNLVSFMESIED